MENNHQSAASFRQSFTETIWGNAIAMLKQKIHNTTKRSMMLILFFLTTLTAYSQSNQTETDSLAQLLSSSIQEDSNRVLLLLEYYRCFLPSKPDSALKISQQALDISAKINFSYGIIKGLNAMAVNYWYMNSPDQAIPTFHMALSRAVKDKNSDLETMVLNNLGTYYKVLGVSDSAEKYLKMAVVSGSRIQNKRLYTKSVSDLAKVYLDKGNYVEAIQNTLEVQKIYETNNMSTELANSYIMLGMIYYDLNNFEKSVNAYRMANRINKLLGNVKIEMAIFSNMGLLYSQVKRDQDSSRIFLMKALRMAEENKDEDTRLIVLVNLGNSVWIKNEIKQALEFFLLASESPLLPYRNQQRAALLVNLGGVYMRLGDFAKAEKFAKSGLQLAQEQKFVTYERIATQIMGDIEAKKKNYKQAFEYYVKYSSLLDTLGNEEAKHKVADLVFMQTMQQKENENLLLQKDIEIDGQTIKIQGFYVITASGIVLLVLILLVLNKRNSRRLYALNYQLELKNSELKKVSSRLALATSAGGVGVWEYDLANNIVLWDNEMLALYGIESKDFVGTYQAWQSMIFPDDRVRFVLEIEMAIQGEKELNTEYRIIWPDGSIHNIRALATLQSYDSGKILYLLGTNWNITEQKKSEAALIKAKAEAEAASKSKSTFLANMSHEIRTPLNAIIGFSQLMNREKSLVDTQKEYVTSINRAGEHLLKLINNILELSKIESGRAELNPTNFKFQTLLNDKQMMFKEWVKSKQIQLIFETSADLPQYIVADEQKLRQILINLIGNAIKFTNHGSVTVRTRVDKANDETSLLIVEIEDTGPGIPEDELGKLFKQFEQTRAGIESSSGTGLGLALSQELALLMNGNITVASQEGKGSVFTVNVEIKEGTPEAGETVITRQVTGIDNPQETYRILVVDDKEENRQVVVNFLQLVGFQTNEAINGEDAITKFEQWNPHLIIMDKQMPVMDGYEATRHIRETEKTGKTPIIVVTASGLNNEKENATTPDIQGYIRKPFRESELFSAIGKALGIGYIYEEDTTTNTLSRYQVNPKAIVEDISKLPTSLVSQMLEAVEGADFHLLIQLIKTIGNENAELVTHLLSKANNYDYDYLQKILISKTSKI